MRQLSGLIDTASAETGVPADVLGAARLAANVPGVALETLFQPLRPLRSLVGMSPGSYGPS